MWGSGPELSLSTFFLRNNLSPWGAELDLSDLLPIQGGASRLVAFLPTLLFCHERTVPWVVAVREGMWAEELGDRF